MTHPGETDRVWSGATITLYTYSEQEDEDRLRNVSANKDPSSGCRVIPFGQTDGHDKASYNKTN